MPGGIKGLLGGAPWRLKPDYLSEVAERLWSYVDKTDTCWLWHGPIVGRGYGKIGAFGQCWRAHRLTWRITHGDIPKGMVVCHSCDTPACCNPDHLFLGTFADNNHDMITKGRARLGQFPKELRPRGDNHYSRQHPECLARGTRHGSYLHPERVARGARHGSKQQPDYFLRGESNPNARLTVAGVQALRMARLEGLSFRELGCQFNVSTATAYRVVNRTAWRHIP